jgi:tetratricopeptide (TPR) repeat protein
MFKLGQRPAALDHYHRAVEKLNALDPARKRASVAHNAITLDTKIADVFLTEGKVQDAVTWFRKGQQGASQLAASDASDVEAAQLVITSSGQLGHALIEGGQTEEGLKYLTLALDKIQAHSPRTPLYSVFESIARMWIGEAWERRGRMADALTEYRKSKDAIVSAKTAGADDLRSMVYYCSSTDRLAAALLKQGKTADAAKEYEECRGILEPLAKINPDNTEVLYALAETFTGEGDVAMGLAKKAGSPSVRASTLNTASNWYQKSLDTWSKVPNPVRISTSLMEVRVPAEVSRKLAESKTLIAARS